MKDPNDAARLGFDGFLKEELDGWKVTSDTGLLAYRELDDALNVTGTASGLLHEERTGKKTLASRTRAALSRGVPVNTCPTTAIMLETQHTESTTVVGGKSDGNRV